jgi:hypothetical protein
MGHGHVFVRKAISGALCMDRQGNMKKLPNKSLNWMSLIEGTEARVFRARCSQRSAPIVHHP